MTTLTVLLFAFTAAVSSSTPQDVPIPEKIPPPPSEEAAPSVSIRTGDNGDRIEEYRQDGRITMVRITPPHGVSYYLIDSNGDGRLDKADTLDNSNVAPVYWVIYEWN